MKDISRINVNTIEFNSNGNGKIGCALAVGVFDGVHKGHQGMLSSLVSEAKRLGLSAAVFTFDPKDSPKANKNLLATEEQKLFFLKEAGVDIVYSVKFSELKDLTPYEFAKDLVFDKFAAKSVVCGYDFRFGKNREGDINVLKSVLGDNAEVIPQPPINENGIPISSTYIRSLIAKGDIKNANRLLGRKFSFVNEVIHGKRLGRTLGFPTINQEYPESLILPQFGVYAVECIVDGEKYNGVANIGVKPTVDYDNKPLCESFLFDYSGDCYGKSVETRLIDFIRTEKRFNSLGELKSQVESDKTKVLSVFKRSVD